MIKLATWLAAGLGCFQVFTPNAQALARVYIANELSFPIPIQQRVQVQPGQFVHIPIPVKAPALVDVTVSVQNGTFNDLNVYVCDELSLQRFSQRLANNCRGINKGRGQFSFRYQLQSPQAHYMVLDNSYALIVTKTVVIQVTATVRLLPNDVEQLRASFEELQAGISEQFAVPEFDIALTPCGQSNAFSAGRGGHITICSELLFELIASDLQGALEAIILHEIAHTLLNLWGLPNWDNEETADELALVILLWSGRQESAGDWIRYFAAHDSVAQASYQLRYGDRHPLSIQRIRNIERIMTSPHAVVRRWNRLMYPRLSTKGLQDIVENPGPYGDRELAWEELENRG